MQDQDVVVIDVHQGRIRELVAILVARRRRREVGQVSRRALQQAHDLDGGLGHRQQLPLPLPVSQGTLDSRSARFQLRGSERPRRARRHGDGQVRSGRVPAAVQTLDEYLGVPLARVGDPQYAHLCGVAAGVEDCRPVPVARLWHDVVNGGQKATRRAHVRQHLDVEVVAGECQAPVAFTGAAAVHQALRGIAHLEIFGVEVRRVLRRDLERQFTIAAPRVVPGADSHLSRSVRVVDDPQKTLPLRAAGRRGEERHMVHVHPRSGRGAREIRQVACRAAQQAHDQNPGHRAVSIGSPAASRRPAQGTSGR